MMTIIAPFVRRKGRERSERGMQGGGGGRTFSTIIVSEAEWKVDKHEKG